MSSINPGHIFNIPEAQGKDAVEFETTAAEAQVEAPTAKIAHEIEANAERAHDVAHDAAEAAKHRDPKSTGTSPVDQLQQQASAKTNAAVAEGQHDVQAAKAAGESYVEKAREAVGQAISTAQSYLPNTIGGEAGTTQEALEKVKNTVQGAFGTAGIAPTPASSTGVPATSAQRSSESDRH